MPVRYIVRHKYEFKPKYINIFNRIASYITQNLLNVRFRSQRLWRFKILHEGGSSIVLRNVGALPHHCTVSHAWSRISRLESTGCYRVLVCAGQVRSLELQHLGLQSRKTPTKQ